MSDSRRIRRMERTNKSSGGHGLGINLIPMMDVLCVLVFFLLFHSFNSTLPEAQLTLPASVAEAHPRETVTIVVTAESVLVQSEPVINTANLLDDGIGLIYELRDRLVQLRNAVEATAKADDSREVTLLADKSIPFKVLKKIMSTCTACGYGKISLAVMQKESQRK
ncbi:MAG TPA: biopolymer transporter ExbD [Nitrospirota bacterium]